MDWGRSAPSPPQNLIGHLMPPPTVRFMCRSAKPILIRLRIDPNQLDRRINNEGWSESLYLPLLTAPISSCLTSLVPFSSPPLHHLILCSSVAARWEHLHAELTWWAEVIKARTKESSGGEEGYESITKAQFRGELCLTDEHHKHRNRKGLEFKLLLLVKSRKIMMKTRLWFHKCTINLLRYQYVALGKS